MLGNWFDPHSKAHLQEFEYLEKHGHWSKDFCDMMDQEGIIRHQSWHMSLYAKMGKCWIEHKLEEDQ